MVDERKTDTNINDGAEAETQAQTDSARDLPAHCLESVSPGAPLSNTAPANCIEDGSRILRAGVDSLYLSFVGNLRERFEAILEDRKGLAQAENIEEQAKAVYKIYDNQFQVLPRGTRYFPYILKDGMYNIQLSRSDSENLPLAYVQIASKVLTEAGLDPSFKQLDVILRFLGVVNGIKVSRLDICCDFTSDVPFGDLPDKAWISRSNNRNRYSQSGRFTGFVFGQGSPISARLYDKTLQIKKSKQDYMRDLWWMEGWNHERTVWRLEFQIRRSVLSELGIDTYEDLKSGVQSLWNYATTNWLRLVTPTKDKTKSRWPNHPLWDVLQRADFGMESSVLQARKYSKMSPLDRYLFVNGLAPLTSYMATRGISTFSEAGARFLKDAAEFHAHRFAMGGEDIEEYCQKRAALKARNYGTSFSIPEVKQIQDYRKGKGK